MKSKCLTLLLAGLLALSLCACGGGQSGEAAPTADMDALQQALLAADASLPEMLSVTSNVDDAKRLFTYLSDFDYDKVDSYLLSYSSTGTADEIAVIAVKDAGDVTEAKNSLEKHRQDRLKLFQTYGPEQAARVEKGVVTTHDRYAILLICDNTDDALAAFTSYIEGSANEG